MPHNNIKASKIFNLILALFFIAGVYCPTINADLSSFDQSPYAFGPEGRTISDLTEFQKPNMMMDIVPYRPVVTRDKYGIKQFYTTEGKLIMSINLDGSMTFQLNGTTIDKDPDGLITKITKTIPNSNRSEMRDAKGVLLGYQILGFGNNVLQEFDSSNKLTKTYEYNKYAKTIQYIMDELTETRTVFDSRGLPTTDINYEGGVVATYSYDEHAQLIYKTDNKANKTLYNVLNGEMDRTEDQFGNVMVQYNYKANEFGRRVLHTSVDFNGWTTYYKNGKPQTEYDTKGNLTKQYYYDGQTLTYVFDHVLSQTTWYDKDGKPTCSTIGDVENQTWLYNTKGKLVGIWDESKNILSAYIRGDEIGKYMFFKKPTAEMIQELIDSGIIKKNKLNMV